MVIAAVAALRTGRATGEYQFPALFNGVPPSRYEGVHQTGEDTFDVVTAVLGLPDEQFAELAARGVFT